MSGIGVLFMVVGGIAAVAGYIWLAVVAFQENVWWGIGSLIIGIVALIFAIMHWQVAKKPFLIELAGSVLFGIGLVLSGMSAQAAVLI